ncbi:MAG: hypothetical protein K8H88_23510, partial [Sandaracinaceae bacterium]|nr:hypothetical protein [Sandaracinaceae bacterium]
MRRIRAAFLSCAVLLILSCSGDNLLLDEAPDDPEFDGIRARLALTIAPGPEGQTGNSACNTTECTSVSFSGQLYFECQATRGAQRVTTGCGAYVREAEARICVADTLLAIIESPRFQVLRIRPGLQGESVPITIGPQDAESNAELAGIALAYAGGALQSAGRALADAGVCSAGSGAGQLGGPAGTGAFASTTLAEELAQFFVEALDLARQAG